MKTLNIFLLTGLALLGLGACSESTPAGDNPLEKNATIEFQGVTYLHRWSGGTQHEYTPKGQENLEKWTDMLTVLDYPQVKDGEGLAQIANAILDLDKKNQAAVVKTGSLPRSEKEEAQHLIIVIFPQPDFSEAAFTRVFFREGKAMSLVYSHRIYGKEAVEGMRAWGKTNGPAAEQALMNLAEVPHLEAK